MGGRGAALEATARARHVRERTRHRAPQLIEQAVVALGGASVPRAGAMAAEQAEQHLGPIQERRDRLRLARTLPARLRHRRRRHRRNLAQPTTAAAAAAGTTTTAATAAAASAGIGPHARLVLRHLARAPAEGKRRLLDRLTVARRDVRARVVRLPQRLAWGGTGARVLGARGLGGGGGRARRVVGAS